MPPQWNNVVLKDCGEWYSGGTPSTSISEYWDGDIPWITASSLHSFFISDSERKVTELGAQNGTRLVPKDTVIFLVRGMSLRTEFRIGITCRSVAFGQDCKAIIVDNGIDPLYLAYVLKQKSRKILGLTDEASHGTKRLQTGLIEALEVPIPPLWEQRKIAQILSTWDQVIAIVENLIAVLEHRKKGLMQRLLVVPQGVSAPNVRFPEFREQWHQKTLGEVFERIARKNDELNNNVLTASGEFGLVSQTEYFNRSVAGSNLEKYYLLRKGEFAYNRSSSDGYPFGAIKQLTDYESGVLSTLYICFRLADESRNNATFFKHFFEAGGLNRGIYTIAQEGARSHGLLNVTLSDFFALPIPVPSLAEQNRLAGLFELQDRLIETTKKLREKYVDQKKGLMQRLVTGQVRVHSD